MSNGSNFFVFHSRLNRVVVSTIRDGKVINRTLYLPIGEAYSGMMLISPGMPTPIGPRILLHALRVWAMAAEVPSPRYSPVRRANGENVANEPGEIVELSDDDSDTPPNNVRAYEPVDNDGPIDGNLAINDEVNDGDLPINEAPIDGDLPINDAPIGGDLPINDGEPINEPMSDEATDSGTEWDKLSFSSRSHNASPCRCYE